MRISDWSSDVCSSDLSHGARGSRRFQLLRIEQLPLRAQRVGLAETTFHAAVELALGQRVQQAVVAIDHHEIFHGVLGGEGGAKRDNAAMTTRADTFDELCCRPIAFVRSPYAQRIDAPHQPTVVAGTETE